jgi:hypothetical protein
MMHDRYLTAALSGMVTCMVLLLGMILVRIIAPPERSSPINPDTTVAVLRGSPW